MVVASFADAAGNEAPRPRARVQFSASTGESLALEAWAFDNPAVLVTLRDCEPVRVSASSSVPVAGSASIVLQAPERGAETLAAVAQVVGPHLVAVGWSRMPASAGVTEYKVYRRLVGSASGRLISVVSPAGSTLRDGSVAPGASYQYSVVAVASASTPEALTGTVTAPDEMPTTNDASISGKGMFLYFYPESGVVRSYDSYDPDAVIAQAAKAGITNIELRTAYGSFFEAKNSAARVWLDRLLDAAAAADIKLLAWSVPRRVTVDDAAQAVASARYRTPSGNGFAGLAVDLEPGEHYMGEGEVAKDRMADYIELVRRAVGPDYLLVATVMSPRLTHWTNRQYPYARIAPYATVMQPMEYWHHYRESSRHPYEKSDVTDACRDAVTLTRRLSGRDVAVNVAGQSVDLGRTGRPSPEELTWCLDGAKAGGAIGEMFFDWRTTSPGQWSAIAAYSW